MKRTSLNQSFCLFLAISLFATFAVASTPNIVWHRLNGEKKHLSRADAGYPKCGSPLLANESNFTVQEIYESDQIEVQIGPGVRIGLACGVSVDSGGGNKYLTAFSDYGAGIYDADGDGPTFATVFHLGRFCDTKDGKASHPDTGYFNTIPQPDPVTRQMMVYLVSDGKILGHVYSKENLDDYMVIRDAQQDIVATANRVGTQWRVDNPQKLSSVHIAFLLTHKLNKNAQCWGVASGSGNGGNGPLGFWPSVGIAAGVSAIVSATAAAIITLACKKSCQPNNPGYQYVPVTNELKEVL